MIINIKYNISLEISRIQYTLINKDFYISKAYSFFLPSFSINSIKSLEKSVKDEYNEEKFENMKNQLLKELEENSVISILEKYFINVKNFKEINLILTKYGTLGSYNPENEIIININTKRNIFQTFIHEIIHLYIHSIIEENNISHWCKESLVDNIFIYLFPNIGFKQNINKNIDFKVINVLEKNNYDILKSIIELKNN